VLGLLAGAGADAELVPLDAPLDAACLCWLGTTAVAGLAGAVGVLTAGELEAGRELLLVPPQPAITSASPTPPIPSQGDHLRLVRPASPDVLNLL
jgi:hypothetical protein